MEEEILSQTAIVNPDTTIKDPDVSKLKEKELRKIFQVQETFTKVTEEILELTI